MSGGSSVKIGPQSSRSTPVTEEVRPDPSDTLILTVSIPTDPNNILAGARIPIYKVNRFPFQFQMFVPNIVKGKEEQFWSANDNDDYLIQGRICRQKEDEVVRTSIVSVDSALSSSIATAPSSSSTVSTSQPKSILCEESDIIFEGRGISKLLKNVPGLDDGNVVRTAAAVPLTTSSK